MASYSQIIGDLENIFASSEWVSNDIQAYPSNIAPTSNRPNEYVIIEVLPAQELNIQYGDEKQVAGLIILQIYTPVNTGTRRIYEISDLLDDVLNKKVIGDSIQTSASSLDVKGNDLDDPSLFRADYVLRFSSY